MDIFNKGNDKGQVINHFSDKLEDHNIVFVGDRIPFPGNDYSLAEVLQGDALMEKLLRLNRGKIQRHF